MTTPEIYLDQLEKQGYFIWDNFLDAASTEAIRRHWEEQIQAQNLKKAGIGKDSGFMIDAVERGDFISWINPETTDEATGLYLQKISSLMTDLNRSFFLGLRDFECHFALYPAGTKYARHVDRHRIGSSRVVSVVFYLNENWQSSDGGQLRIYQNDNMEAEILPASGRLAAFLSEKEHEVMETGRPRMSITGWMRTS
jgi:SM-20-related protein